MVRKDAGNTGATKPGSFSTRTTRSVVIGYVVALLSTAGALGLTFVSHRYIAPGVFLFFYPAVVLSAWYAGFGPGLLAVLVGMLTADVTFFEPIGQLYVADPAQRIFLLLFVGVSALMAWLVASFRTAQRLAQRREAEARALADQLSHHSEMLQAQTAELEAQTVELEYTIEEAQSARQQAELERRRVSILAETSRALTESNEYEGRLLAFAQLIARELADFCAIDVVERDGRVVRMAAVARTPEGSMLVQEIAGMAPSLLDRRGVGEVLRTGEPQVALSLTEERLRELTMSEEHLQLAARLELRSLIIMPLRVGDRSMGAISVLRTRDSGEFEPDDVELVRVLATRAAVLIELARLYRDAQEELQRRKQAERELQEKADQLQTLTVEQEETMAELEERTVQAEGAEQAALEASQAKSQFLAVMSHELRTPLNAIMGYTDLLQSGASGLSLNERGQNFLDRIRVSVLHLRGLIDEVLSLARIEAGKEDVTLERVSLQGLVRDVATMLQTDALQKGLRLDVEVPDDVVIATDPRKLRQILINLTSNAVKFTDRGQVTLRVRREKFTVEIDVSDTGTGIAPDDEARIFEPFTQVDQSRTRRVGGSGLGLAVSRKLVALLGGELRLESEVGMGSTFTVVLPV